MRYLKSVLILVALGGLAILVLRSIYPMPEEKAGADSFTIAPTDATALGAAILQAEAVNPGKSAVLALADGREALAARVFLIRSAEVSLDVQYYIWQEDTTGLILLDELRKAAERGVRVRLLLDDNGIPGLDPVLAALDSLPTVEVRLFNPFTLRSPKLASYLFDFPRLNRRMHNKSLTADGIASVVGGRNVGDIYFSYGDGVHYFDLDVLVGGPGAEAVADNFDLFWNSDASWPAHQFLSAVPGALAELIEAAARARETVLGSEYVGALRDSPLVRAIVSNALELEWAAVTLISDSPAKATGEITRNDLLMSRVAELLQTPVRSVDLVSAYFIPGTRGTEFLTSLARKGVSTRVLTNSLEATDVPPVHGAYVSYRPELVAAGVEVLELRANPEMPDEIDFAALLTGSASSLHAKTLGIDGERIFIGSFNFDPRSVRLNTEMGFLIDSPTITRSLSAALDQQGSFYRVTEQDGALAWAETTSDGTKILHTEEPGASTGTAILFKLIDWLPVEWLL